MLFRKCGGAWMEESKLLDGFDKAALTSLAPSLPYSLHSPTSSPQLFTDETEKSQIFVLLAAENWEALLLKLEKTKCDFWPFNVSDTVGLFMWLTFWLMIGPFCTAPPTLKLDWQPQVRVLALLTSSHSIIQSHKKEGKCAVSLSAGAKCLLRLQPTSFSQI